MKSPFVSELQPNHVATAMFLVQAKDVRQKKTGEPYLSLILCDRTGEIDAKMWDNVSEVLETFDRDDFVRVKGVMQIYQNRPQLTIHKMQRILDEREVDPKDYFPASLRDPDEMFAELQGIIQGIGNPHLQGLLTAVLSDPEIAHLYKSAPAAKSIHHAYLGGLLEHVLSLCTLSRMAASHYKSIDLDLLLTGAVLHDIGKIRELSYDRSFGYSNDGQLLGHIVIALGMIHDKLRLLPDFPAPLRTLVEHMVISHHGDLEYGSPKVPVFLEALLLHHLDNLDSKMECMRATAERDSRVEGCWTAYSPALERVVLKKAKYLNGGQPARNSFAPPPQTQQPAAAQSLAARAPEAAPAPVPPSRRARSAAVPPRHRYSRTSCSKLYERTLRSMRRIGPARDIPPPLELECLKILWALGRANVKDVRDSLASRRNLAYTTVMTVLDRLVHKGGVSREKLGRSFVYTPLLTREGLRRVAVRELLDCFFDGSEAALVDYLRQAPEAPAERPRASAAAAVGDMEDQRIDTVLL